jgi:CO/xanthine dehydrogenase Mo-binding subunit
MRAHTLGGNQRLGAARLVSCAIYINSPPNGAFSRCNSVYNTCVLERHTDDIYAAIGMAPLEFRRRNGSVTTISVRPDRCSRATFLRLCSTEWAKRATRAQKRHLAGDRLYGRGTAVGTLARIRWSRRRLRSPQC